MQRLNKQIYKFFFNMYGCYRNYINKGFLNHLPKETRENILKVVRYRDKKSLTLAKIVTVRRFELLANIIGSMQSNEIPCKSLPKSFYNLLPQIVEDKEYVSFKYLKKNSLKRGYTESECVFKYYNGNLKNLNLAPSQLFVDNHFVRLNCKINYVRKPQRDDSTGKYTQKITLYDDNTHKTIEAILYNDYADFDKWINGRKVNILGYIIHPMFHDDNLPPFQVVSIDYDLEYEDLLKHELDIIKDYYCEDRSSSEYEDWRDSVIERDGVCQCCGGHKYLEAHHIFSWEDYPDMRINIDNGVTLCKWCHGRYNSYFGHKGTGIGIVQYLNKFGGK